MQTMMSLSRLYPYLPHECYALSGYYGLSITYFKVFNDIYSICESQAESLASTLEFTSNCTFRFFSDISPILNSTFNSTVIGSCNVYGSTLGFLNQHWSDNNSMHTTNTTTLQCAMLYFNQVCDAAKDFDDSILLIPVVLGNTALTILASLFLFAAYAVPILLALMILYRGVALFFSSVMACEKSIYHTEYHHPNHLDRPSNDLEDLRDLKRETHNLLLSSNPTSIDYYIKRCLQRRR